MYTYQCSFIRGTPNLTALDLKLRIVVDTAYNNYAHMTMPG